MGYRWNGELAEGLQVFQQGQVFVFRGVVLLGVVRWRPAVAAESEGTPWPRTAWTWLTPEDKRS